MEHESPSIFAYTMDIQYIMKVDMLQQLHTN